MVSYTVFLSPSAHSYCALLPLLCQHLLIPHLPSFLPSSTLFPFSSPFLSPSLPPSSFFILLFSTSAHPFPPPLFFCFSPQLPSTLLLLLSSPQCPPPSVLPQPSPNPPPVLPTTSLLLLFFSPLLLLFCHLYFPPFFLSLSLFLCCAPYRHLSFLFIVTFHFLSLFQPSSCSFSFFYLILFSSSYLGFPLYTLFLFLLFSSSFLLSPPPFHRFSLYSILTNFPPPPLLSSPFYFYFISLFPPFESRQLFLLFLFCSTFLSPPSSSHLSLYLRSVFPFRYLFFHLLLLPFPPTLYFTAPSFSFFIVFIFVFTSPFTFSSLIPFPLCRLSQ